MRVLPLPIIPIRAIIDSGVFGQESADTYAFVLPHVHGTIARTDLAEVVEVFAITAEGETSFVIEIIQATLHFGKRYYFICPCCVQARLFLVIYDNTVICGEVFQDSDHFRYSKSRRRALMLEARERLLAWDRSRVKREVKLRSRVTGITTEAYPRAPEIRAVTPSSPHASEPLRQQEGATAFELTTERGLILGRGAWDYDLTQQYVADDPDYWRELDLPSPYARPAQLQPMFDTPVLDMRVLCRESPFREGRALARTLGWPDHLIGGYSGLLMIQDWRGAEPFIMMAHRQPDHSFRWQRLEIVRLANGRLRFLCPVSGRRCDLLYWRDGSFASWQFQRLYHRSQRAGGRKRAG